VTPAVLPYFQLGPWDLGIVTIHAFGVFVCIGVILAEKLAVRRAETIGVDPAIMSRALGYLLIAGFIGGHVFGLLFYDPGKILSDPLSLLRVWELQSSYSGILGALIGLAIFSYRHREQSIWRIADAAAFALPVGWFFGRVGCAFAHDHPGYHSDFFLAVAYPDGPRHDLGLYEAFWWIAIIALFFLLDRIKPELRARYGFYPGLLALVYAPVRFALELLRTADVRYFGLTPAQYTSIAALALGIFLLTTRRRTHHALDHVPVEAATK
jgi:phosphatidylglycerol:prolipoprotein diacylglycerol transferase